MNKEKIHVILESSNNSAQSFIMVICEKFLKKIFLFSFSSVWKKLLLVPTMWPSNNITDTKEIRLNWRYFNYFILEKSWSYQKFK